MTDVPLSKVINSHAENHTGVTIFSKEEPRSVYNLVSEVMQKAIEMVDPQLYNWSEKALERHATLDVRDYQLRIAFWREYNYAQDNFKPQISLTKVCQGVCSKHYFYDEVLTNFKKLAWVLYPPSDYTVAMQELLDLSTREMRSILLMPVKSSKGVVNTSLINQKIKLHLALENRVKGSLIQRVAVAGAVDHRHAPNEAPKSLEELDREIRLLEKAQSGPGFIDVKQIEAAEVAGGESALVGECIIGKDVDDK